jgi:hypothetical protein
MINAYPPLQESSPSWYGVSVATPQQREDVALMATRYGMYAPPMRQFPPEALINQEYSQFMQQHLNHAGVLAPPWGGIGEGREGTSLGGPSLTPRGAVGVLAGCQGQAMPGQTVGGMGHYSNMLETPADQIRQAIEYTLQHNQRSAQPQEWAIKANQLQAEMNLFVQQNAWAFFNAERGKPWGAPPSKAAAHVWADLIDKLSTHEMLQGLCDLFPQITSLRNAWRQEDASFAPVSPAKQAWGTALGIGAIAGIGWLVWNAVSRPRTTAVQPIAQG